VALVRCPGIAKHFDCSSLIDPDRIQLCTYCKRARDGRDEPRRPSIAQQIKEARLEDKVLAYKQRRERDG